MPLEGVELEPAEAGVGLKFERLTPALSNFRRTYWAAGVVVAGVRVVAGAVISWPGMQVLFGLDPTVT